MNKTELVAAVAESADLSKADAARAIDAFFGVVGSQLKKKDKVSLVGFGTFSVKSRKARDPDGMNSRLQDQGNGGWLAGADFSRQART